MGDDSFWDHPQGAAIFKHAILRAYAPTFASKTGRFYGEGHVAIVDGYAGPGAYDDGSPGSPDQILKMADEITAKRKVHPYFVEENRSYFAKLKALVDKSSAAGLAKPLLGKCSDHLPAILAETAAMPLFVFIDPYGLGIPFDQMVGDLMGRNNGKPPTEVLFNFVRSSAYRTGGKLNTKSDSPTQHAASAGSIERMNEALGGDWWQALHAKHADGIDFAVAVRDEYVRRVMAAAGPGWRSYVVEVADIPNGATIYDLVLFTQHAQGAWYFNDAVSLAHAVFDQHHDGFIPQLRLEIQYDDSWERGIADNLLKLTAVHARVPVVDHLEAVYGQYLGIARGRHVRAAVTSLVKQGKVACEMKDEDNHALVVVGVRP